jgi:uncharacterized membrane protein YccC
LQQLCRVTDTPKLTAVLWQAARILAACGVAYGAAALIGLKEGYWALISVVVVMQPGLSDTWVASRNRVAGTLIGAAVGGAVLEAVARGAPREVLFWATLAPLAVLTAAVPTLRLSCITLVIVVLVPSGAAPLVMPVSRVGEILLGTGSSLLVALIWPGQKA